MKNGTICLSMAPFVVLVGVAGFEPAASCSQSRRDNRATLHPEKVSANIRLYFYSATEKKK